jgi:hypothetical protein
MDELNATRARLAAATSRAERAERELDDKTVALAEAEAWITRYAIERDQARSRAERAEAEVVRLRALADDPTTNPYWRLRSERAEAAIERVRALAAQWKQATGWRVSEVVGAELFAALDAQRPAEEESTPGFGTVTRADMEFVAAVTNAPAAREVDFTPAFEDDDWSQRPAEGGPEGALTNCCPCDDCEVRRRRALEGGPEGEGASIPTGGRGKADEPGQDLDVSAGQSASTKRAAALDGGQPATEETRTND